MSGLKHWLLGSVSHQLLERAPCSVLVFRGSFALEGPLNVVVGLDGSEASLAALARGAALGARLRLVHVIDPHIPFMTAPPAVLEELRRRGRKVLRDARARITSPLDGVVEELPEGSTREELIAACGAHGPTVAVVGSRGVHGFRRLLVGSTARELVNRAPCPVLVTRAVGWAEER